VDLADTDVYSSSYFSVYERKDRRQLKYKGNYNFQILNHQMNTIKWAYCKMLHNSIRSTMNCHLQSEVAYMKTLPRLNLSGWEVADVWLVLTSPLLPLPFQTFAFKIQFETWGSFLTKSLASPCTSTSSLAPAILSASPVAGCVWLFVLQRCSRPRSCICCKYRL